MGHVACGLLRAIQRSAPDLVLAAAAAFKQVLGVLFGKEAVVKAAANLELCISA